MSAVNAGPTPDEIRKAFPYAGPMLRFRSERAAKEFFGQLSDGWGEQWCELEWWWDTDGPDGRTVAKLHEASVIGVEVHP